MRAYVPCYLGGCTFRHHALAYLETSEGNILIEYGGYLGKDEKYPEETIYYDGDNGARFTHLSQKDFLNIITDKGKYNYYDKTFETTIMQGMKLKELFQGISNTMNLTMDGYNVADNNCHDFIANAIKILRAKRIDKNLSKMHNFAKLKIPPKILEPLEDNEEYYILTSLGKIPFLGVITDVLGTIITD